MDDIARATLHLEEWWREHPVWYDVEHYRRHCAFGVRGEIEFRPWPQGSDLPDFSFAAAKSLLEADPLEFPLRISEFAFFLRRAFVIESLGFKNDAEGQKLVQMVEIELAKREGVNIRADRVRNAVADFCLKLGERAKRLAKMSEEEKLAALARLEGGGREFSELSPDERAGFLKNLGGYLSGGRK